MKDIIERVRKIFPDITINESKLMGNTLITNMGEGSRILVISDNIPSSYIKTGRNVVGWNEMRFFNCVMRVGTGFTIINMNDPSNDVVDWVKNGSNMILKLWIKGKYIC